MVAISRQAKHSMCHQISSLRPMPYHRFRLTQSKPFGWKVPEVAVTLNRIEPCLPTPQGGLTSQSNPHRYGGFQPIRKNHLMVSYCKAAEKTMEFIRKCEGERK